MHINKVTLHREKYPTDEYYPFNLEIFRRTGELALDAPVTMFVGENGTGKSTLMEAMAERCGIHIWRGFQRKAFEHNPYRYGFGEFISVEWTDGLVPGSFFGSTTFQNFVKNLDEWASTDPGQLDDFGGKSLASQSHGQSIMAFFENRYRRKGLYFLDEPETALSPRTQLALLELLTETGRAGHAQFVVATHSPIILACPGARIYDFDHSPIRAVKYEDTEHFKVYKSFLENRGKYTRNETDKDRR